MIIAPCTVGRLGQSQPFLLYLRLKRACGPKASYSAREFVYVTNRLSDSFMITNIWATLLGIAHVQNTGPLTLDPWMAITITITITTTITTAFTQRMVAQLHTVAKRYSILAEHRNNSGHHASPISSFRRTRNRLGQSRRRCPFLPI